MHVSRASAERPLASRLSTFTSAAARLRSTRLARDARWLAAIAALYALAVIAAALSLHPYFSRTWDVVTFAAAARTLLSGSDWAGLYAQTRVEQHWPYAYPPLHAAVVAPLLALGGGAPDWLLVRVPPLVADIGVGLVIYTLVARRANTRLARLAFAVWLLNPVTFYDTAVQGHFEAEWLLFVLVAYALAASRRGLWWPALAFAAAFLFKQVAILFAIPYWVTLLVGPTAEAPFARRLWSALLSGVAFALPVLLVSLPFLLYSGDYLYMNLQYVADVPLQTQSWLVALAGLFGPQFFPLTHSTLFVALAALLLSFYVIRRGASLALAGAVVALAFFLLSQKVMGYYYAIVLPFALVELVPARRLGILAFIVGLTAWIAVSPYFAAWANPAHLPLYALLGALNSALWVGLLIQILRTSYSPSRQNEESVSPRACEGEEQGGRGLLPGDVIFISSALFFAAVAAALVQPLVSSATSPIRAPMVAPGAESNVALALVVFSALLLLALAAAAAFSRRWSARGWPARAALAAPLFISPLYFLTFTLTKESTAFLETALKSLGL